MGGIDWGIQANKTLGEIGNFVGKKFWRDYSNGSDSNEGTEAGPVKTLQEAIDRTVSGRGDMIICKPGGEPVTTPVLFNKSGIMVVASQYGANPFSIGELFSIYAAEALVDSPVATVTERCLIQGLGFAGRDSRTAFGFGAALLVGNLPDDAGPFGVHLKGCRFPKWGLDNSKGIALMGPSDIRVEACGFEGGGADFDAGIYLQGAAQNVDLINNIFRDCTYAIETGVFAGGGPEAIIMGNIMQGSKFLNCPSALTGLVCDNWSPYSTNATTYNDTVTNMETLGLSITGNHYSEE